MGLAGVRDDGMGSGRGTVPAGRKIDDRMGSGGGGSPFVTSSGYTPARQSAGLYVPVGGSRGLGGTSAGWGMTSATQTPSLDVSKLKLPSTAKTVAGPERPNLPPIDPTGQEKPEHAALRQRYTEFGTNLKEGTGFAMDVLQGQLTDRMEAQVEQARQQYAELGIPFDEGSYRAELQRGVNAAMAEEKLGRESLYQEHLANIAPITAGADYAQAEKGIDLQRDMGEASNILERYGIDVQKYGQEVQAAQRASEMLLDFYKSLMNGLVSFNPSYTGNVSFG